jgi:hypothetical protein
MKEKEGNDNEKTYDNSHSITGYDFDVQCFGIGD